MAKQHVNWTLENECIKILKEAQKTQPRGVSISSLVEYAITKTFVSKRVRLVEEIKETQQKLCFLGDQLRDLDKESK